MSEFELIDRFVAAFDVPRAPRGPGDDCAVLRVPAGFELCVTSDAIVEGVHFLRPAFSLADVGHKALAVNLSDLAAMGARPAWFLCSLQLPRSFGQREVRELARGMAPLARAHRCALVGGNFTAAGELSVSVTAAGLVPRGEALLRGGGRPGDLLYVSGTLGEAAVGLEMLLEDPAAKGRAVARQKRPVPRLALGELARRFASAAIDVSDGLIQDLGHLCRASGVSARVEAERVPGDRERALAGGEDYELLLAVPSAKAAAFERACARAGQRVSRIGQLKAGGPRVDLGPTSRSAGRSTAGFDHFRVKPPFDGVRSRK